MALRSPPAGDPAVDWLLSSDEPAVRFVTRRDLVGEPAEEDADLILTGPKVSALLADQQPDGGLGSDEIQVGRYRGASRSPEHLVAVETVQRPGRRWGITLWRLTSLTDLAVPAGDPRVAAAVDYVLTQLLRSRRHQRGPTMINNLPRVCASGEGAALRIACQLGLADDPRAHRLAEALLAWQWPDGGWNCHRNASGRRSSFHESLLPAWGLHEYAEATGDPAAASAAGRAAELFLEHRLVHSLGSGIASRFRPKPPPAGAVINSRWVKLSYPSTWHYDLLSVLRFLAAIGRLDDPGAADGLDRLEGKRRADGRWAADVQWWQPPDSRFHHQRSEVDWGRPKAPSELITLLALRILHAAGRLPRPAG